LRILFVADDLYPGFGGQARATEGHAAALVARGHQVRAVAGGEPRPTEPPPGVELTRLPSWTLGDAQTRFAHPLFTRLAPLVEWADVVHANTPTALAAAATIVAKQKRRPVVMGIHTQLETSILHAPVLGAGLSRLLTIWYGWLFGAADRLVAPTSFAAESARGFTDKAVQVVSNGIDLSRWPEREPAPAAPGGVRRLAYVGRLSPEKRPHDLLRLMSALPDDYVLTMAGNGPLRRQIEQTIFSAGLLERVRLVGFVTEAEKRRLLYESELFVMPSPVELQSIATLEAMAAGCAVAAFGHASSAVPRLVNEAGAGIVLDPDDIPAQVAGVRALAGDGERLAAAGANARAFVRSHDVGASAQALEAIYRELLSSNEAAASARSAAKLAPAKEAAAEKARP